MGRTRPPEDRLPHTLPPIYIEGTDKVRYELAVTVDGVKGLVFLRWHFDTDSGEMSIRGKAGEAWERRLT